MPSPLHPPVSLTRSLTPTPHNVGQRPPREAHEDDGWARQDVQVCGWVREACLVQRGGRERREEGGRRGEVHHGRAVADADAEVDSEGDGGAEGEQGHPVGEELERDALVREGDASAGGHGIHHRGQPAVAGQVRHAAAGLEDHPGACEGVPVLGVHLRAVPARLRHADPHGEGGDAVGQGGEEAGADVHPRPVRHADRAVGGGVRSVVEAVEGAQRGAHAGVGHDLVLGELGLDGVSTSLLERPGQLPVNRAAYGTLLGTITSSTNRKRPSQSPRCIRTPGFCKHPHVPPASTPSAPPWDRGVVFACARGEASSGPLLGCRLCHVPSAACPPRVSGSRALRRASPPTEGTSLPAPPLPLEACTDGGLEASACAPHLTGGRGAPPRPALSALRTLSKTQFPQKTLGAWEAQCRPTKHPPQVMSTQDV